MVKIPVNDDVQSMDQQDAAQEATSSQEGAASPAGDVLVPEGALYNPEAAHGQLHLGIDVGSTTVKLV